MGKKKNREEKCDKCENKGTDTCQDCEGNDLYLPKEDVPSGAQGLKAIGADVTIQVHEGSPNTPIMDNLEQQCKEAGVPVQREPLPGSIEHLKEISAEYDADMKRAEALKHGKIEKSTPFGKGSEHVLNEYSDGCVQIDDGEIVSKATMKTVVDFANIFRKPDSVQHDLEGNEVQRSQLEEEDERETVAYVVMKCGGWKFRMKSEAFDKLTTPKKKESVEKHHLRIAKVLQKGLKPVDPDDLNKTGSWDSANATIFERIVEMV